MGQALYRKYRSKSLSEIVGQEHITHTLNEALKSGRISHAYLFTGPRGVGKTSIARIWAHEINKIPYDNDDSNIDIIEIDAASNRRIDEIRELRDKVYIAPANAKYKVYIIDEVHMLTKEAFNALLKTLEEPPEHVVFILATTDAHKLPETIVSRTQRFNFKPVDKQKTVEHLRFIAGKENIKIDDAGLGLIADHGQGSFRDSISLLDQLSSYGSDLKLNDVETLLGIPSKKSINELVQAIAKQKTPADMLVISSALQEQGFQATAIARELSEEIRTNIVNNSGLLDHETAIALLADLLLVPQSYDSNRSLEITLLKMTNVAKVAVQKPIELAVEPTPEPELVQPIDLPIITEEKPKIEESIEGLWTQVLRALKEKHNTLYGVVRMAEPTFSKNKLKLSFQFAFHQKQISDAANTKKLSVILQELTGKTYVVECVFDKTAEAPKILVAPTQPAKNEDISAISNIFGGAELLES